MDLWNRLNSIRLLPIAAAFSLVACGPTAQDQPKQAAKKELSLLKQMNQEVTTFPDTVDNEVCDKGYADTRKKLINAVESHSVTKSAPKTVSASAKSSTNEKSWIPFANGGLVKMARMELKGDDWQSYSISWKSVDEYYEKNKTEKETSGRFWNGINGDVSTLMEADFERLKKRKTTFGKNLGISKDNVDFLPKLYARLKPCAESETCISISWTSEEQAALKSIPTYDTLIQKLPLASENADRRTVITQLFKVLAEDVEQYAFKKNTSVQALKEDQKLTYILPLDGHSYTDSEREFLKKSIEDIWNSEQAQVRIEWKLASENKDVFEVIFQNSSGRASTFPNSKKINLFSGTTDRAIAHEIGHVLGFPEHYYQVWNLDQCSYETQYNIHDLMSNQFSGDVTSAEWEELAKQYPISTP